MSGRRSGPRAPIDGTLGGMSVEAPGTLIGAGRNADVYDIGDGRVLRRYRDGRDPRGVELQAQVMRHARAFGAPVPEVFEVSGPDIVMERADGPTMLEVLGRRPWTLRRQARVLARLHHLVHQVPALPGLRTPCGDTPCGDTPCGDTPCGDEDKGSHVLVHRDLHPMNVILTATGPVIIDWEGAAAGPAIYDVALTWAIVDFSQVPGSGFEAAVIRAFQSLFTRSFVRAAGPIDQTWRAAAVRHRMADPNTLPEERARMERFLH
jgi:aminoglycoside phosphotransferase (APT) family kinase protein